MQLRMIPPFLFLFLSVFLPLFIFLLSLPFILTFSSSISFHSFFRISPFLPLPSFYSFFTPLSSSFVLLCFISQFPFLILLIPHFSPPSSFLPLFFFFYSLLISFLADSSFFPISFFLSFFLSHFPFILSVLFPFLVFFFFLSHSPFPSIFSFSNFFLDVFPLRFPLSLLPLSSLFPSSFLPYIPLINFFTYVLRPIFSPCVIRSLLPFLSFILSDFSTLYSVPFQDCVTQRQSSILLRRLPYHVTCGTSPVYSHSHRGPCSKH